MSATNDQIESLLKTVYEPLFKAPSTATGSALAATVNDTVGIVTTEQLTKGPADTASYVITNNKVKANSIVFVTCARGSLTTGVPVVVTTTPAAGSFTTIISNEHATDLFDGTLKLSFLVLNPQV